MDDITRNSKNINLNKIEKKIFPFFNDLKQGVPVEWMVPFLCIIEDFQYLQYVFNHNYYTNLPSAIAKAFTLFNSDIYSSVYYYILNGLLVLITLYIILSTINYTEFGQRNLMVSNSIYLIVFKYLLSTILNFFGNSFFICKDAETLTGIPNCSSTIHLIINIIIIVIMLITVVFGFLYSNLYINPNCLSNSRTFGSIQKNHEFELLIIKYFLALQYNTLPDLLNPETNIRIIQLICLIITSLLFFYISKFQLKRQPYYSSTANNYRYAVYFSMGLFSLYTFIICIIKINTSKAMAYISLLLYVIMFIVGYFYNNYYSNIVRRRVFKKLREKKIIHKLKKSLSSDELRFSPEKLEKKDVYKSVERITVEKYVRKEIKIFNNYYECEVACRFLRQNRNIEAFNLMRRLIEEGIKQFKHDPELYIIAWYYIFSMKNFYKENGLLSKFEQDLFECNILLHEAIQLKLKMREKFLINNAEHYIEKEKRESSNLMTDNINMSYQLDELKNEVVMTHIYGLREIKNMYAKLRHSATPRHIDPYLKNIIEIGKYQNLANSQYRNIIRQYPDSRDIVQVYIMFLTDVMSRDDEAYKYNNMVENNNKSHANELILRNTETSYDINARPKNGNDEQLKSSMKHRPEERSSNSLNSDTHSEGYSGINDMGKYIRKKVASKQNMIDILTEKLKGYKLKMNFCILIFIAVFAFQAVYVIKTLIYSKNVGLELNLNIHIPGTIKEIAFNSRLISMSIIAGDGKEFFKHNNNTLGDIFILDTLSWYSVNENMNDVMTSGPLIIPIGKYAYDTFETITLSEAYNKLVSYLKYVYNRDMNMHNETALDLLFEPHFRYFMVNAKSNFDTAFKDSKDIFGDIIINKFNTLNQTTIILSAFLIINSLLILYLTYGPLKNTTTQVITSVLKMYRFYSRGDFEEIITSYEEKIEGLCESYEIDKELVEHRFSGPKKKNYENVGLGISFLIIFFFIAFVAFLVFNISSKVKDLVAIAEKSADRYTLLKGIQLFTYEVINQDRSLFLEGEPERILSDSIKRLETLQEELKTGSYGGPTFDNYPALNYILKDNGCHRMYYDPSCMFMMYEYDNSYGFTEEVATLPINELISEYLYHVKGFMDNVKEGKYDRLPFSNEENIKIMFQQVINDNFFRLQEKLVNNLIGDIQVMDDYLISSSLQLLDSNRDMLIYVVIFGSLILLFIDVFVFNKAYKKKISDVNTLISFVFLMPQPMVNKMEKFKRFLETAQFDGY